MRTEMLTIRIDPQTRERLHAAAQARGKTLSRFMLEAAMKEVESEESKRPKTDKPQKKPWVLADLIIEKARTGGANGYYDAGHTVAEELKLLAGGEGMEEKQFKQWVTNYDAHSARDAWLWFSDGLSRLSRLVPAQRRHLFALGFQIGMMKHWDARKPLILSVNADKDHISLQWNRGDERFSGIAALSATVEQDAGEESARKQVRFRFILDRAEGRSSARHILDQIAADETPFTIERHFQPYNGPSRVEVYEDCRLATDVVEPNVFSGTGWSPAKQTYPKNSGWQLSKQEQND